MLLGTFVAAHRLAVVDLIARRPDVRQAEAGSSPRTRASARRRRRVLPTFTLYGPVRHAGTTSHDSFNTNGEIYQIFGGLSIPLFHGGALRDELRASRARAEQARFAYEQAVLVARREAEDAFVGVRTSRDQAVAQQRQVDALRRAFDLANRRYQNGVSSYLEVLDAAAQSVYERAGAHAGAATGIGVRRAAVQGVGGGWPSDTAGARGTGGAPGAPR